MLKLSQFKFNDDTAYCFLSVLFRFKQITDNILRMDSHLKLGENTVRV